MKELSLYGKTKSYGNLMLYLGTLYSYIDRPLTYDSN